MTCMFTRPRSLETVRRASICMLSLLGSSLLLTQATQARPARIDRGFGQAGIAAPIIGPRYGLGWFTVASEQADGAILATYQPGVNEGSETLYRYRADGSFDQSFSPQPPPSALATPSAPRATLPDGSTLIAVVGPEGSVEKLDANGAPDTSYGHQGRSDKVPFWIQEILPLPSGKVVVAGTHAYQLASHEAPELDEAAVFRFNADGTHDSSFGTGGMVGLHIDAGIDDRYVAGLVPRPAGGLAVVVNPRFPDTPGGGPGAAVVGLTESGALDSSFGENGVTRLASTAVSVNPLPDGGIDVAGNMWRGRHRCCADFALAHLTANGHLDPAYGTTGLATMDLGGDDRVRVASWESDGSVLLGGSTTTTKPSCRVFRTCREMPALARFDARGKLDPGFGDGGLVRLKALGHGTAGSEGEGVRVLNPRPGGGFLATGRSGSTAFVTPIGPDGSLYPDFGEEGSIVRLVPKIASVQLGAAAVDRRGHILVQATSSAGLVSSLGTGVVIRYRRNGALDRSYGGGRGFAYAGGTFLGGPEFTIAADRWGRALTAQGSTVTRLTPAGLPDVSFGRRGARRLPSNIELTSVIALRSGKVLLAGSTRSPQSTVVVRLDRQGELDRRFGDGGIVTVTCRRRHACAAVHMARDHRGRILLAGWMSRRHGGGTDGHRMAIARLLPNGRRDVRFGKGGWALPPAGGRSGVAAIAMQGGRILVAGWSTRHGSTQDLLLRYGENGRLDRTFGRGGIARGKAVRQQSIAEQKMTIVPVKGRIVVLRTRKKAPPVLVYGRNGHPVGLRAQRLVAPDRAVASFITPSPVGVQQQGKVVLTWNRTTPSGEGGTTTELALQRLLVR
jgi:uncharacterized delta-60 repeat protein